MKCQKLNIFWNLYFPWTEFSNKDLKTKTELWIFMNSSNNVYWQISKPRKSCSYTIWIGSVKVGHTERTRKLVNLTSSSSRRLLFSDLDFIPTASKTFLKWLWGKYAFVFGKKHVSVVKKWRRKRFNNKLRFNPKSKSCSSHRVTGFKKFIICCHINFSWVLKSRRHSYNALKCWLSLIYIYIWISNEDR